MLDDIPPSGSRTNKQIANQERCQIEQKTKKQTEKKTKEGNTLHFTYFEVSTDHPRSSRAWSRGKIGPGEKITQGNTALLIEYLQEEHPQRQRTEPPDMQRARSSSMDLQR